MNVVARHHRHTDGTLGTAAFSPCDRYRYTLSRTWNPVKPQAVFILMNPSTADERQLDPTLTRINRRVLEWAALEGKLGGWTVLNAFAWRETDSRLLPTRIAEGHDIVGPLNDATIVANVGNAARRGASLIVCGWGKPGRLHGRDADVLALIRQAGGSPQAFAVNKDGTPKHPLYVGYNVMPHVDL